MSRAVWFFFAFVVAVFAAVIALRLAPGMLAFVIAMIAPAAKTGVTIGWTAAFALAGAIALGFFTIIGALALDLVDAWRTRRAGRGLATIDLARPEAQESIEAILAAPPMVRRFGAPFRAALRMREPSRGGLVSLNVPAAMVLDTEYALARNATRLAYRLVWVLAWSGALVLAAINVIGQQTSLDRAPAGLDGAALGAIVAALPLFIVGVLAAALGAIMASVHRAGLARLGDLLGERVPAIDPDTALQEAIGRLREDRGDGAAPGARLDQIVDRLGQRLAEIAAASGQKGMPESKLVETFEALRDELATGFGAARESTRLLAETARDLDRVIHLLEEFIKRDTPRAAEAMPAASPPEIAAPTGGSVGKSLTDLRRAIGDLLADNEPKTGRSHS